MVDLSKIFPKVKETLLFKEMDDGAVIYEPAKEICYSLNSSSAYIWSLCDGNFSVHEIIDNVKQDFKEFHLDPQQAVIEIIKTFQNSHLIEQNIF